MSSSKMRTLRVMEILLEETDDNHILKAADIMDKLKNCYDIDADRRTIYGEIQILKDFNLDVITQKGKNPGFYIGARDFELAELKLLVDAVQSSKSLTEKKTRELIKKLKKYASKSQAEMLSHQVSIANRPKTENETVYYNVDMLHTAIYRNKKIRFQYGYWTMKKEMELKRDGKVYEISPWALTWDDENYYLVGYDEEAKKIKHYRVDKMLNMEITRRKRQGEKAFQDFDLADFAKKTFGMYGGEDKNVVLICHKSLAGVVIDRFGHDVSMIPIDEDHFRARVKVSISPQFFGWVTGIGENMRIDGPVDVRTEYIKYLETLRAKYNTEN